MASSVNKILARIKIVTPLQVFALITVLSVLVIGVKYFGTKEEWLTVRIDVRGQDWTQDFTGGGAYNPPSWLAPVIKRNDAERGLDGRPIATILSIETYGDIKPTIFLIAKIRVITNKHTHEYSFKNRLIQIGAPIDLSLAQTKIVGQITDLYSPENGYPQKNVIATVRIRNIEPWIVNRITVGDKMLEKSTGGIAADILSKTIEDPTSTIFFNNPNYFTNQFLESNPRLKDVVLTVRLKLLKLNEGWRFAGNQILKIGSLDSQLRFYFSDYSLPWAEVEEFHDEPASK